MWYEQVLEYFRTEPLQKYGQLKSSMATIINRSQNTVWCLYNEIP